MLQPDAFFDPYNPQSLNRYSYVLNNPTTYTDPTGNYRVLAEGGGGGSGAVALNLRPVFEAAAGAATVVVVSGSGAVERGIQSIGDISFPCVWKCGPKGASFPGFGEDVGVGSTLFIGGADPVEKGQRGVDVAEQALKEMGYDVRGKEVTLRLPDGRRIRVDIWAERDGKQIGIEVKTGQEGSWRVGQEQSEKYGGLEEHGGVPRGERAELAGLEEGEHVGNIEIEVVYVED